MYMLLECEKMKLGVSICGKYEGVLQYISVPRDFFFFGSFFNVSQSCPGHVRRGLGRRRMEEEEEQEEDDRGRVQDCVLIFLFF